eukprot:gnl/TRDRNA2_/TRDRNA2_49194_c0_seq1.p1 gnl/TRDRNA2_/TRDRNA2_49194_c0~~gnl/TRDRNA2_/TRDRNA2_49194_c0_seq1.p1  ORF type:complete len:506 (+),score=60.12 gnl/TRDRNA2_/TRDRNA2_49194_c0_seq1:75-1592(+)
MASLSQEGCITEEAKDKEADDCTTEEGTYSAVEQMEVVRFERCQEVVADCEQYLDRIEEFERRAIATEKAIAIAIADMQESERMDTICQHSTAIVDGCCLLESADFEQWTSCDLCSMHWEECTQLPVAILNRRRHKGITYFLVRWKYTAIPTWETENDLQEEGFGYLLQEFQHQRDAWRLSAPSEKRRPKPTSCFDPTKCWPDFKERLYTHFAALGYDLVRIENVCDQWLGRRFDQMWQEVKKKDKSNCPLMLFHGTASGNMQSIIRRGLLIPGRTSGIKVANGSAHGVGVYTARSPSLSLGYCRGHTQMLCCAGLTSAQSKLTASTVCAGDAVVFFQESLTMPCFLLTFESLNGRPCRPLEAVEYWDTLISDLVPCVQLPGCAAGMASNDGVKPVTPGGPRYIRSGCTRAAAWYDQDHKTLSKRQIRTMPRAAKQAYKQGLLSEPRFDRTRRRAKDKENPGNNLECTDWGQEKTPEQHVEKQNPCDREQCCTKCRLRSSRGKSH